MLTATEQSNALIDARVAGAVRAAEADLHALECHGCRLGAVERFLGRHGIKLQAAAKEPVTPQDNPNQRHAVKTVLRSARLRSVSNGFAKADNDRLDGLKKELERLTKANLPNQGKLFGLAKSEIDDFFAGLGDEAMQQASHLSAIIHHVNVNHLKQHFDATVDGHGLDPKKLLVFGTPIDEAYAKLGTDLFYRFKAAIRAGLAQDETPSEIADRLDGSIAASPVNAAEALPTPEELIDRRLTVGVRIFDAVENAFNNIANALVDSLANGVDAEDADDDEEKTLGYEWVGILDAVICPACEAYTGQRWNEEYEPVDEDGMDYPGDPPLHTNCFVGDTNVIPVGRILAITKRKFDGYVVNIITSDNNITCTPNHPILTESGWVAAKFLKQGSRIVSYPSRDNPFVIEWENKHGKTAIKEVAESFLLSKNLLTYEVPTSAPDFHGDGSESKIAIIGINPLLRYKLDTTFQKKLVELSLISGSNAMPSEFFIGFGLLHFLLKTAFSSFGSSMSRCCQFGNFIRRGTSHACKLLFASSSDRNASPDETLANNTATNADNISHSGSTKPGVIKAFGLSPINNFLGSDALGRETEQDQATANSGLTYAKLASHILDGKSGVIHLNEVIGINVKFAHDFVYNLETESGYYLANGIASHNCRCSVVPSDLEKEPTEGSFRDYMANFSDEEKREAFGSRNYEAWKAGKISDSALSNQKDNMLSLDKLQDAYLKDGGLTEKQVKEGIPDLVSKYWPKGKK